MFPSIFSGFTSYEIVWPLLWCHTLLLHDTSASHSHGVQHCSYIIKPQNITNRLVTSNLGPLCVSYLSAVTLYGHMSFEQEKWLLAFFKGQTVRYFCFDHLSRGKTSWPCFNPQSFSVNKLLWFDCRVWATVTGLIVWLPPPLLEMWGWRLLTASITCPLLMMTRITCLTLTDTKYANTCPYVVILCYTLSLSLSFSLCVTVTLSHWRKLLLSKVLSKLWTRQLQQQQ